MGDLDDYDFSSTDAGASLVTMTEAGQVKPTLLSQARSVHINLKIHCNHCHCQRRSAVNVFLRLCDEFFFHLYMVTLCVLTLNS